MRTALGRARGLVAFLLLALSVGWLLLRRRSVAASTVAPVSSGPPGRGYGSAGTAAETAGSGDAARDVPVTDALVVAPAPPAGAGPSWPAGEEPSGPAGDGAGVPDGVLATDAGLTPEPPAGPDGGSPSELDAGPDGGSPSELDAGPDGGPPSELDAGPAAELASPDPTAVLPEVEASEAPTTEIPAVRATDPVVDSPDDLRALRGVGPSMERLLQGLGVCTYRQLATLEGAELERVRAALPDFRSRIEREDWVGQARELHRAKYGEAP